MASLWGRPVACAGPLGPASISQVDGGRRGRRPKAVPSQSLLFNRRDQAVGLPHFANCSANFGLTTLGNRLLTCAVQKPPSVSQTGR